MSKSSYHYEVGADGKKHRVYENRKKTTAPKRVLKGKGGYYDSKFVKGANKYIPKGFWNKVGTAAGGMIGAYNGNPAAGAAAGGMIGTGLSKIMGFGAYTVKSNSIISEGQSPARMHSNNASFRVRHREYIADVVSSGTANAFSSASYSINPGLATSFPWLAPIAAQYEQYKVLGMVYEFKTLSADAVASSQSNMTIGGIIMSTNYNAVAPAFTNKQQMDNAEYTTSDKPSCSFYHAIECAPGSYPTQQLYVRAGNPASGSDLRMYDLGTFQVASFGIAATNVILGELWCTYEIELTKPISTFASGAIALTDHYKLTNVTNSLPLGSGSVLATNSSIGGTIVNGLQYVFPPTYSSGSFLVTYSAVGTSAAISAPSLTLTNASILTVWRADSATTVSNTGDTTTTFMRMFVITITAPNAAIVFGSGGTLPSSVTGADLWVCQIDSDIST